MRLPPHHPQRPLTSMRPPRGLPVGGRVPRRRRRGVSIVRRRPEGGLPGGRRRAEERRAEGRRAPAEGPHLGQAGREASPAASSSRAARLHPRRPPPRAAGFRSARHFRRARRFYRGGAGGGGVVNTEWTWPRCEWAGRAWRARAAPPPRRPPCPGSCPPPRRTRRRTAPAVSPGGGLCRDTSYRDRNVPCRRPAGEQP